MSATDYLSAIKWGTGNGKETTATIGTAVVDVRQPPSVNHVAGLQITRYGEVLLAMTDYFAGGQRVRMLATTSNQFGVGEYGLHVFSDGSQDSRIKAQVKVANVDTYVDVPAAAVSAKGDLLVYTGTRWIKVAAGTNTHVLTADSAQTGGIKWAAASGLTLLSDNNVWTGTNAFNGSSMTIGNATSDDLTITSRVASSVTFKAGASRTISVAAPAAPGAGDFLYILGAAGNGAASNAGFVIIDTGAPGAGGDAAIVIGADVGSGSNVTQILIGATTNNTTIDGYLTIDAKVRGDFTFRGDNNHTLKIDARETAGAGRALTIAAGAATTSGAGGMLEIKGGAAVSSGDGGEVIITGGAPAGAGTIGAVKVGQSSESVTVVGTTGKLAFFAGTPAVKQTAALVTAGFTAGVGTAAKDDSGYTGNSGLTAYTVGDLVAILKTYGMIQA